MKTVVAIGRYSAGGFDVETTMHTVYVVDTTDPYQHLQSYQAQCNDCSWVAGEHFGDEASRNATSDARDHTNGEICYV